MYRKMKTSLYILYILLLLDLRLIYQKRSGHILADKAPETVEPVIDDSPPVTITQLVRDTEQNGETKEPVVLSSSEDVLIETTESTAQATITDSTTVRHDEASSASSSIVVETDQNITTEQEVKEEVAIETPEDKEDVKTFSEWTRDQLEKTDKNLTVPNNNGSGKSKKVGNKNYASPDCGAKVVGTNSESSHSATILNQSHDEYLLCVCSVKIWFVVQLCEPCQIKKIDLANFELFSSSPREFTVSISDRYPSRDWITVGKFEAKDERTIQEFKLEDHDLFGKYVKVEVLSHWSKEHFCPISLFRVYGSSEYEVLEETEKALEEPVVEDDEVVGEEGSKKESGIKNIITEAKEAVMNLVRKAGEAFTNGRQTKTKSCIGKYEKCMSMLEEYTLTWNSTGINTSAINRWISCHYNYIESIMRTEFMEYIMNTSACSVFTSERATSSNPALSYLFTMVHPNLIHAICFLTTKEKISSKCNKVETTMANTTIKLDTATTTVPTIQYTSVPETTTVIKTESDTGDTVSLIQPTKTQEREHEDSVHIDSSMEETTSNLTSQITISTTKAIEINQTETKENTVNTTTEEEKVVETTTTSIISHQREPQFLRLNNKIKMLEQNLSLSSQYLEELSRKYKRQVVELQNVFNTTASLSSIIKSQQTLIKQLNTSVNHLTSVVQQLTDGQAESQQNLLETHIAMLIIEALIVIAVVCFCLNSRGHRRASVTLAESNFSKTTFAGRRHSVSCIASVGTPMFRQRRPSDINISGSYSDLLIVEPALPILVRSSRKDKRRRKRRRLSSDSILDKPEENTSVISSAGVLFSGTILSSSTQQSLHNGGINRIETISQHSQTDEYNEKKSKPSKFFRKDRHSKSEPPEVSESFRYSRPRHDEVYAGVNGWGSDRDSVGSHKKTGSFKKLLHKFSK